MEQNARLTNLLEQFHSKKVLLIGDFYLDEYISTAPKEISPESPVLRSTFQHRKHVPGAAGNVALALRQLNSEVCVAGVIGKDFHGNALKEQFESKGIVTEDLILDESRITGVLSRILSDTGRDVEQHVIRIDYENSNPLNEEARGKLLDGVKRKMKDVDIVFLADYNEHVHDGLIDKTLIQGILEENKIHQKLLVGISRKNIELFENFDLVILNEKEAKAVLGISEKVDHEILAKEIKERLNVKSVIITAGAQGLIGMDHMGPIKLPSFAKKVIDVCGAGDSLSAAVALSLVSGAELRDAAHLGSISAAVTISKPGTNNANKKEIINFLDAQNKITYKFKEWDDLLEIRNDLKNKGKKVVFANGYFDFILPGQIKFLHEAKKLGDILIVGLNSDGSVRANKGAGRPLLSQEDRITIMSSLEFVDYITIFEELTPINLIRKIKPDFLVKGGTYTKDEIVGKDIVEGVGGEVVLLPLYGDYNTDDIISKIKEGQNEN